MSHPLLPIIYDDSDIVVVNKPGGLLAVPGRGAEKHDSVTTRARILYPEMIEQPAVHRLDMYTSGLMVLAKTKTAHRNISVQFEKRLVQKRYLAWLEGVLFHSHGTITLSFRLDTSNRPYQIYDPLYGKSGTTHWKKLQEKNGHTLVEFTPVTGRTHQLRLHASHPEGLGTPIKGDSLYGNGKEGDTMYLHASYLEFNHPITRKRLTFKSLPSFSISTF